ncbi:hypothetical protein SPF06_02090 [Sinomonas sp. JGH33]|uniref:Uncharacterized protein n=1 Tax=Sinomonas terricola TaxID=3110330 RepID=A0ABU5T1I5_9MICC|nr:hypothetical protein [Sinomonas sp. JGH33]MEA5453503.1 hypothetical protein [Sinomonas sp. JGH33]
MSTGLPQEPGTELGPSMGTVVWGVIVVALAGIIGASRFGWFTVAPEFALVALLVVAGIGLVGGGILASLRGRRGRVAGDGT